MDGLNLVINITDRDKSETAIRLFQENGVFTTDVALGQGTAPVAAVYAKAVELNVPMVVESETLQPDGLTEAKICIDYLKSLEK